MRSCRTAFQCGSRERVDVVRGVYQARRQLAHLSGGGLHLHDGFDNADAQTQLSGVSRGKAQHFGADSGGAVAQTQLKVRSKAALIMASLGIRDDGRAWVVGEGCGGSGRHGGTPFGRKKAHSGWAD